MDDVADIDKGIVDEADLVGLDFDNFVGVSATNEPIRKRKSSTTYPKRSRLTSRTSSYSSFMRVIHN